MGRGRAAQRLDGLGSTIFAEMSALAASTGSINLGQGFPDTDGPAEMIEAAVAAMRGGVNQYPPGPGIPELRAAIAAHGARFAGLDYDPDGEVLVTTGATEAIAAAVLALVDPGDEVIALEPYYDCYAAAIAMAGGRRVPVTLRAPDFRLDVDALRAAVTPRTRLLLLNSPHNPTGTVLTRAELAAVADVAIAADLVVVSDEVYEHLVFDGEHVSIATLPGMRERTVRISSAGKTFSVTGWKIGWACAPPDLLAAVRAAKQFLTYVSGAPFQPAIALALALPDAYFAELRDGLRARRDQLCDGLAALGLTVYRPAGTYFVTTDVRPLGYPDGVEFCRDLPRRAGVVAIPLEAFFDRAETHPSHSPPGQGNRAETHPSHSPPGQGNRAETHPSHSPPGQGNRAETYPSHPPTGQGNDPDAGRTLVRWAFCKRPEVLAAAVERLAAAFAGA